MAAPDVRLRTPRDGGGSSRSLWRQRFSRTRARSRSSRSQRSSSPCCSGGAAGRRCVRPRSLCCVAAVAAVVVAVAVYYAHFIDTYRAELARIGAETATAAPDAGGRGIGGRLERAAVPARSISACPRCSSPPGAPRCSGDGARAIALTPRRHRLGSSRAALFLVLGILTPVDMRYYLAAIPALAIASRHRRRAVGGRLAARRAPPRLILLAGTVYWRAARLVGYALG